MPTLSFPTSGGTLEAVPPPEASDTMSLMLAILRELRRVSMETA